MSEMIRHYSTSLLSAAIVLLAAIPVSADWSTNPYQNNPVDVSLRSATDVEAVTDGEGGMLVFYLQPVDDSDTFPDLLVQKVDANGDLVFATPVVVVDGTLGFSITFETAVADGAGGAFVAFTAPSPATA